MCNFPPLPTIHVTGMIHIFWLETKIPEICDQGKHEETAKFVQAEVDND